MSIEIIVPRLGWSMEQGSFVAWLKKDGEMVQAGQPLFSIEGDKALQEIESIDSGILRIAPNGPKPGDSIQVGDVLGHLTPATEPVRDSEPATPSKAVAEPAQAKTASTRGVEPAPVIAVPEQTISRTARVHAISPRALRVAAELGVDWTTVIGTGRTGRIRERDVRAAVSSDTVSSPAARGMESSTGNPRKPAVLVTGGCGFIGTWVIRELLERELAVVVLDASGRPARWKSVLGAASERVPLIQGSLLDRELLARVFAEYHVGHAIHLAALLTPACQADPWEGCRVNVLATVALLEQIRKSAMPIKGFSYASSVAVFGDEADSASGIAEGANHPFTFYGVFKKSVELIAEQYWRHFGIASVGIRPQVAYGPEREVGLTAGPSLAARAAARGEGFCINYTGRVGYDYVEDVARAFVRGALETLPGAEVVDLPGEVAEVEQVIAAIGAVVPEVAAKLSVNGPPVPAHAPLNPRFISVLYPDWKTTSLADGIRRTVRFYQLQPAGNLSNSFRE